MGPASGLTEDVHRLPDPLLTHPAKASSFSGSAATDPLQTCLRQSPGQRCDPRLRSSRGMPWWRSRTTSLKSGPRGPGRKGRSWIGRRFPAGSGLRPEGLSSPDV